MVNNEMTAENLPETCITFLECRIILTGCKTG